MKYGYFDDAKNEYVITNPKTPYPWINYLGTGDFFSILSNTGGGYSFYKDARLRRITRYRYNNVPLDNNGKYFFVKDGGCVWSPTWQPVQTELDGYECRHGFSYTKFNSAKNLVSAKILAFVPLNENCEIQLVTLKNNSSVKKQISLFSFVEWCLYNAQDDCTNFQRNFSTGEVEIESCASSSTIYHKTEYRERRNHFAFHSVNTKAAGFDTDREAFFGLYNNFDKAQVLLSGQSLNSVADGWSPVASHRIDMELEAGEEKSFIFILGYAENSDDEKWTGEKKDFFVQTNPKALIINKAQAYALQEKFSTVQKVLASYEELGAFWKKTLSTFSLDSGDEKLDRQSKWNQYQCVTTYNFARSASYFESGIGRGIGFRDTSQDLMGAGHLIAPERLRERMFDVAATQFKDGSAYHQFQPLTKKGNADIGSNFNDDPLWLIMGVANYIKETGDYEFLKVQVPFDNDENDTATMYEHLKRSYNYAINHKGPHGLPLIGRADWNDCLNLNCFSKDPNDSFQTCTNADGKNAESVMIAEMFVFVTDDYVNICKIMGDGAEAEKAIAECKKMEEAVCTSGWDGEWYVRAYDDAGNKIGSKECDEGKIFIESQGFGTMAQIGKDKGYPEKSLDSVKRYLDTKYGICILYPAYSKYRLELGEVSSYPQGYKENGGIFCHNNPWIIIGEALNGRPDEAFMHYTKIAPAYIEEISDVHRTEPYVYCQMIAGKEAGNFGQGKNSWLTGTASWNFVALSQYIAGIKPEFDGLRIEPHLPAVLKEVRVTRIFRGTEYKINIHNKNNGGQVKITCDNPAVKVDGLIVKTGDTKKVNLDVTVE